MNSLIATAVVLLILALVLSRLFPLAEGFEATQADICATIKKNKADISSQLDQANASVTDANAQIAKIQASLADITAMSTSFSC
jgi:outer membrane lipoprotein-sorting protein